MKPFYVASKVKHAKFWRSVRAQGYPVISTWIDKVSEGRSNDFAELADRCIKEIKQSSFLLLKAGQGELLKGALIEAGAALAFGIEVRCVGRCASLSKVFKSHPNWKQYPTVTDAIRDSK